MFWICVENRVDNIEILLLLLSNAYTETSPLLLLSPPHQGVGWGYTRGWGGDTAGTADPS